MAESLGIERGRLNDLILGKRRATLGEHTKLSEHRPANRIIYEDDSGQRHSFYTGRGNSYETMLGRWDQVEEIGGEIGESQKYIPGMHVTAIEARLPKSSNVIVESLSPSIRHQSTPWRPAG